MHKKPTITVLSREEGTDSQQDNSQNANVKIVNNKIDDTKKKKK